VAAGGPTEAPIRQVILVAYWLNIGPILGRNIGPISCVTWEASSSNITEYVNTGAEGVIIAHTTATCNDVITVKFIAETSVKLLKC